MKEKIKELAKISGFDIIGFSPCQEVEKELINFYLYWIKENYNGDLKYLEKNLEKRFNPKNLMPSGKTIISLGVNYYSYLPENCPIPRYLTKIDYHKVLKYMMSNFIIKLKETLGNFEFKFFVDTGPVLEKYWAKKSGLGFIGKNSLLINPEFGSFIFLCEIIIDIEIEPDHEIKNLCGSCKKCIEHCPTGAIISEGLIDVRKCLSYLTIEKKEFLTEEERRLVEKNNKIFGCEICQEVCPFNKNLKETKKEELKIPEFLKNFKIEEIKKVPFEELKKLFKGTVFERKLKIFDKKIF